MTLSVSGNYLGYGRLVSLDPSQSQNFNNIGISFSDTFAAVSGSTGITSGTQYSGAIASFPSYPSNFGMQVFTSGTTPTFAINFNASMNGVTFQSASGFFPAPTAAGFYGVGSGAVKFAAIQPTAIFASGNMSGSVNIIIGA